MYSVKTSTICSQPDAMHKSAVSTQQIVFMFPVRLRVLDVLFISGNHVEPLPVGASSDFMFHIQGLCDVFEINNSIKC